MTRPRPGRRLLLLALLAALLLPPSGSAAQAETAQSHDKTDRAESFLPASTLVYLELPDLGRSRERFGRCALGAILQEPTVVRFFREGLPFLAASREAMASSLGVGWEDFREAFPGQVVLGLMDARPLQDETLYWLGLVAQADPDSQAFVAVRDALLATYARRTRTEPHEQAVGEAPVTRYTRSDGSTLLATTTGGRFLTIWGPDREHTEELLADVLSRDDPGLAQDTTFKAVRPSSALAGEDLYFYVNLARVLEAWGPDTSETLERSLALSGLTDVPAAALSLRIEPPGVLDQVYLLAPVPRRGLLESMGGGRLDEDLLLGYVPIDAVSFSAGSLDLKATYDLLWSLSQAIFGSSAVQLHGRLTDFEARAGVDIGEDILGQLGPEVVRFTVLPKLGPVVGRADTLVILTVRDRQHLQAALAKLKTHTQQEGQSALRLGSGRPEQLTSSKAAGRRTDQTLRVLWEEREFDGHPFTRLVIANPLWSLRPGFAFYHDESTTPPRDLLLVALRSRSLEHLLSYVTRSREEGTLRLGSGWPEQLTLSKARPVSDVRTNPDFTKLRGRLPGEVSDLGYSDLRRRFESSYAWALTWASVAQGVGGEVFFDPDLAPPTGDVARHLFGLIAVTSSDERGVLFQAYSPIGYSALVTGAGAGVGLALPQALRAHRRKTREDCQVHLRRIGVELALYAADHQGAFPTSLEELRDLLLTRSDEEGLPGDGRWFQCPGRPLGPGIGYEYVPGATLGSPPGRMVAYDREKNHRRGRNVLFADGRVLWFREDVFNQLLRSQREKAADMEKKQPE